MNVGRKTEEGRFRKKTTLITVALLFFLLVLGTYHMDWVPSVSAENFSQNVIVIGNDSVRESMPSIAVDSHGRVFVTFEKYNTTNQSKSIYVARSENGGLSFHSPVKVNNNLSWGEQPSIAVANDDKIHVVWTDWRNDADLRWVSGGGIDGVNNADIYHANSTDGGRKFNQNVRVDDAPGTSAVGSSTSGRIIATDSVDGIHVVWMDVREGFYSIYYANSTDGGITFSNNIKVPDVDANAMNPSLAINPNDEIYVAWYDYRNVTTNADIYLASSTDGGLSFSGDTRVNDDLTNWNQMYPVVAAHQDFVSVIWEDGRNGGRSAFFSKSLDKGITFSPNIQIDDALASAINPTIAVNQSGYIVVAWEDTRGANTSIYFSNSTSQGLSFSPNQKVRDSEAGNVGNPSMTMDRNGYVYVTWSDTRNAGDQDIYFARAPAEIADLQPISIDFNPPSPVGEYILVGLNATITNNGDRESINVEVQFFHEDPSLGEQIGSNLTIPLIRAGGKGYAETSWLATPLGFHEVFVVVDPENIVTESNESNNILSAIIEVVSPPPEVLPPDNLRTSATGNDLRLDWESPIDISNVSHYLIYRAQDQREFDFSAPTHNTSSDVDPRRTNWTDMNAASPGSPTEYYYTVRTVSPDGRKSITSNTAGKWTRSFDSGLSSFSLPLEPFDVKNISWYADTIPNTEFVRWMDSSGHWITHDSSQIPGVNDIQAEIGVGYEISLTSPTTFTFCGYPASMIRFKEGLGDSIAFRKSLTAIIVGDDVNLTWQAVGGADSYSVFRSETRNGLHNLSLIPTVNITETYWRDVGVLGGADEFYYAIIPADAVGRLGSSTYSIGVVSFVYSWGSDTFALPLKPLENHSLDWYCDAISDVAGMAHSTFGEWKYHAREKPSGVYDRLVQVSEGYQISISGNESRRYEFIGW